MKQLAAETFSEDLKGTLLFLLCESVTVRLSEFKANSRSNKCLKVSVHNY